MDFIDIMHYAFLLICNVIFGCVAVLSVWGTLTTLGLL